MRRIGLHHVDIVVSSLERSLPLYRELLEPLGYVEAHEVVGERGDPVWYLDGDGVGASLGIREAQTALVHDRYAPGLHHLAFEASSPEQVTSGTGGRSRVSSRSRRSRRSGRTCRATTRRSSTIRTA